MKIHYFNKDALVAVIDCYKFYFSHETCIAISMPTGQYRSDCKYSNTTSRHVKLMGIKDFTVIPENQLKAIISLIRVESVSSNFSKQRVQALQSEVNKSLSTTFHSIGLATLKNNQ